MKSITLLDSVVFQLTPTRTRCDLVITANGESEKIASGLLNPFLAHLKAAQDQIGKGGYSIVLEPNKPNNAKWFTKGTVERFVRFVSSPDILERVYIIESEMLQIQKAISFQNDNGSHKVENLPVKSEERLEGSKSVTFANDEKAIVLYQPASPQSEEDASIIQNNSKVQLVQVLETRKSVLQKEQGMAFARAVAASFDVDNIATLLAFAECFGASRMKDACQKFLDLWKAKHENGQWVEVEATPCQSNMPYRNASGIVFLGQSESQHGENVSEKSPDQGPPNLQEHTPSQFSHPMFPPWQTHPQVNGMPVFQPFPMQGSPYFPNYIGQSPFLQSPYTPRDDSKFHSGRKTGRKTRRRRHSMDTQELTTELETQEYGSETTSDNTNNEEEYSSKKLKNKIGISSRKKSGAVIIQNLNYVSSEKQDFYSDDEKKLKKRGVSFNYKEERMSGKGGDGGNWKAFENFLLNNVEENNNSTTSGVFGIEDKTLGRKRQSAIGESQMLSYGQDSNPRHRDSQTDLKTMEGGGRRGAYRKSGDTNMDYIINRREKLTDVWDSSLDPVISNGYSGRTSNANNKGSLIGKSDESLMVLQRSRSTNQVRGDIRAMDMDCELASTSHRNDNSFEPHDLNLMPNRAMEGRSSGYDLVMDSETRAQNNNSARSSGKKKEVGVESKGGPRKKAKGQELKGEKRTIMSVKRPSKLSPVEDARARAERVRAYKADLHKLKKEKEEEQRKRLEALKIERQKRITTKSGANPSISESGKRQVHKLSPVSQKGSKFSDLEIGSSSPLQRSKLNIISKVSRSLDASKISKSGRLSNASQTIGNRLTRSTSSLKTRKEDKNGPTAESLASMSKIRRLSESKGTFGRLSESKISATSNMVKQKSRRLSEGKVRASNTSEVTVQSKSTSDNTRKSTKVMPQRTINNTKKSTKEMSQRTIDDIRKSTKEMSQRTITVVRKSTKDMPQRTTDNTKKSTNEVPQKMVDNIQKSTKDMPERTVDNIRKSAKDMPQRTIENTRKSAQEIPQRTIDNTKKSNKDTPQRKIDNILPSKDVDNNTIVEKTVVMLECEKPSTTKIQNFDKKIGVRTTHFAVQNQANKQKDEREIPPLPASPITVKIVDQEKSNCIVKGKTHTHTHTRLNEKEKVLPNVPSIDLHKDSYQAPYARVSSLEDPCLTESEYVKAPPSVDMEVTGVRATKAYVSDTRRSIPGNNYDIIRRSDSRKYQEKESPKGFKKLLMFGKKNSSTSERSSVESEKVTHNGSMVDDRALKESFSEVFTMKNHTKQEESTSAGTTPNKSSSRPFSLLSHFRNKNIEKKLTT